METSGTSLLRGEDPKSEAETLANRPAFNAGVLAELGVKLVGLMFVLDGVGGLIAEAITLFLDRKHQIAAGLEPEMHSITAAGFASSFFFLFAGVYLMTNGKAVIELILMTDSKTKAQVESD